VPAWLHLNRGSQKLELLPERQLVVRRIFEEYLGGRGHHAIADGLNADGVPCFGEGTRKAKYWHRTYVRKILNNPATHGVYVPHTYVYEGSRRIRKPLAPVENYYPAVVNRATFDEVRAIQATVVRPMAKTGSVANILGGLAVCPRCGATMTRVYKGSKLKAGRPKLVCTRAKAGMGCTYHGVDLSTVENAIVANPGLLVHETPSGNDDADQRLRVVLTNIDVLEDSIGNLVEVLERRPSEALSERLALLEAERSHALRERDELLAKVALSTGPILDRRLAALEAALGAVPLDRAKANVALRAVLLSVTVDYTSGQLVLAWKHGGESRVLYAFPRIEVHDCESSVETIGAIAENQLTLAGR
jgi:hypothetical protein